MPLSEFTDLSAAMHHVAGATEWQIHRLLRDDDGPEAQLFEAMRYAVLTPRPSVQPFLVFASATLFGVSAAATMRVAAAVQLMHGSALTRDTLPAIGGGTGGKDEPCHARFGKGVAILAGDALQALAFEALAHADTHGDPAVRASLVSGLARAAGAHGCAGGQMMELQTRGQNLESASITRLQRLRTGGLISFACLAGAVLGKTTEPPRHALQAYAHDLGLAMQIDQDLRQPAVISGQEIASAAPVPRASFVAVLGPERARSQVALLAAQAGKHLDLFGAKADLLRLAASSLVRPGA